MTHIQNYAGVTPTAVRQLLEAGAILLDVRTHCEHAGYHVEGAVNIPYDEIVRFRDFIMSWNKPVVTFSTHGRRSRIAAMKLREMGLEVYDAQTIYLVEEALNAVKTVYP